MSDSGISPTGIARTLGELWERAPAFFWALAISGLVVSAIAAGAELLTHTFPAAMFWIGVATFWVSLVFATARSLQDNFQRSFHIAPIEVLTFAHVVQQTDGSITTQIVSDMDIFNSTADYQIVANVVLSRPKTKAELLHCNISLFGNGTLKPSGLDSGTGGRFRAHIIVRADLGGQIARRGVVLSIFDHRGRRHPVRLRRIRLT